MPHTIRDRDKLKARLARIRGQINALDRALDEQKDCGDVLQQIAAIRGAVTGLLGEVLEGHVREHLAVQELDTRRCDRYGVPMEVLTDNGRVFTGRFGPGTGAVLLDRICRENGIEHLLTGPRSPTTIGKIGRWHRTMGDTNPSHVGRAVDRSTTCAET